MSTIDIRVAEKGDISALYRVAVEMSQQHEMFYFEKCLEEQQSGRRLVFVANDPESAGRLAGYVQLNRFPLYAPFRRLGIFEIQDLNVIPDLRCQGIGAQLVARCEKTARQEGCADIGISVGLYARYGAAQRLYVRRGYIPDGAGVSYDDLPVSAGKLCAVDDLLTLKLVKPLT